MFRSSLLTTEGWHSGGCFPLEETLFTIKFHLQVKEMMHLIPNHCFSPEGLYCSEVVRVCPTCPQTSIHNLISECS